MSTPLRIGNQTALASRELFAPFEFAIAHGFDAFEWFPDKKPDGQGWDETDLSSQARYRIRKDAHAHDIRLSVHGHMVDGLPDAEAIEQLEHSVALAEEIGAEVLNIHLETDNGFAPFLKRIEPILQACADRGIMLALENTPEHSPEAFNAFFETLHARNDLPSDLVGMCLDLGHANLCESTRNDYLGFVDRLSPEVPIVHLHLHENFGDADSHLTLFTGPARHAPAGIEGLLKRLEGRGYLGSAILEQWPEPPSLLLEAKDRLDAMLPDSLKKKSLHPAAT